MYTTQELWQVSLHDPILASVLRGVFPSDKYFVVPDESEFFDSYEFPPETYDMDEYVLRESTYFNDKPLQGLTSDVCGDYCLFYLLHRARNVRI